MTDKQLCVSWRAICYCYDQNIEPERVNGIPFDKWAQFIQSVMYARGFNPDKTDL